MISALRRILLFAAGALCVLPCARATWATDVDMQPDSGIDIGITLAFETFPRAGYMPCRITIQNHTGQSHSWNFSSTTYSGEYNHLSRQTYDRSLAVTGPKAVFDVLIPISPTSRTDNVYRSPGATINGPGVRSPDVTFPNSSRAGRTETSFVAMSPALSTRSWKLLKTELEKNHNLALLGSEVDLNLLSEDWRGLLGVGAFFISTNEYSTLRPAQRQAVRNWVVQGGNLILYGGEDVRDFGAIGAEGATAFEMGLVRRMVWDEAKGLDVAETAKMIGGFQQEVGEIGDRLRDASPRWIFAEAIGRAARNILFLALFITLFAVAVGPLNLFWFAGANRRHRLFWTTPLISVSASVLLGGFILVQDGFGGHGVRMTLRYLLPSEKQVIVMQEQASRTGLLLSRGFTGEDGLFLAPTSLPSRIDDWQAARTLSQSLRTYGGDWFLSRSVQGHFAEAIVPSREAVELVSAPGESPEIRSGLPVVLKEFFYIDPQGGHWSGENLRTGERVKLAAAKMRNPIAGVVDQAGPMMRRAFKAVADKPGHFYATAESAPFIETLPSIRWIDEKAIYTGAVTAAP